MNDQNDPSRIVFRPRTFIAAEIDVLFETKPSIEKKPQAPSGFIWDGTAFSVESVISEWHSFERTGRMGFNMKTPHLREAERRGSWGVGRFYFRVLVEDDRIFDLYYDRSPESAADRKGHWFLWREMEAIQ
jgi:hypothetical protein